MIKTEDYSIGAEFARRVKNLGKGDITALRRAFGLNLDEADGNALASYYKCLPQDETGGEATFLAATAIAYISHYEGKTSAFAYCLLSSEISESRVKALISNREVDDGGFFHSKYSRLVKFCVNKGYLPDVNEIYPSLKKWQYYRKTLTEQFYNKQTKKQEE